jgi:hypothetical protein
MTTVQQTKCRECDEHPVIASAQPGGSDALQLESLVARVRGEYVEMPGLRVTFGHPDQAGNGEYLPLVGDFMSFGEIVEFASVTFQGKGTDDESRVHRSGKHGIGDGPQFSQ